MQAATPAPVAISEYSEKWVLPSRLWKISNVQIWNTTERNEMLRNIFSKTECNNISSWEKIFELKTLIFLGGGSMALNSSIVYKIIDFNDEHK